GAAAEPSSNRERRKCRSGLPTMDFSVSIGKRNASGMVMTTRRHVHIPFIFCRIALGGSDGITGHVRLKVAPVDAVRPFTNKNKGLGQAGRVCKIVEVCQL